MAQPDLLGILDAEHQNLGVYYGLGEKSPSLCTKSRFPSPTFLAVNAGVFRPRTMANFRPKMLFFHRFAKNNEPKMCLLAF